MFVRKIKNYFSKNNQVPNLIRNFSNHSNHFFWIEKENNNIYNVGIKRNFINNFGYLDNFNVNKKFYNYKIPILVDDVMGEIKIENNSHNLNSPLDNCYLINYNNDVDNINNNPEDNPLVQLELKSYILHETYFKFL